MSLTDGEAVFVDISVKPCNEEPVSRGFPAIACIAKVKQDFEIRLEKLLDDSKDGGFYLES